MTETYDIAIVGSGFAGSLLAMIAKRLGRSVILLERGTHPRVVIGESSTPFSNLLLEELSDRYDLSHIRPLAKWGSWQREHPEIACGLKRGFTFHHHVLGAPAMPDPQRRDQLLVAASPNDRIADTHWYRADFDHFLVKEAQALEVEYRDRVELIGMSHGGGEVSLDACHGGKSVNCRARFVVDATGPRGFVYRALSLKEAELPGHPQTQTLYSHFSGVKRLEQGNYSRTEKQPPFPIDDAAVHHIFDGGWVWVLHFNNGVTSAGVAATNEAAARLQLADGSVAWERLMELIPALREQFSDASAIRPFSYLPRLAFRSAQATGPGWAMLPSAAGFVDPLLSTGFPLALLGVARLAEIIEQYWTCRTFGDKLRDYAAETTVELLATGRLIGALYSCMNNFRLFTAVSLLYFAAASYSEAARRLKKPSLAKSFLLSDDPAFGPACIRICDRVPQVRTEAATVELVREIHQTIEPFDIAGLGDLSRRNWHGADPNDLLESSTKLGANRPEVQEMLRQSGFVFQS